jgi:hypothetical protein
VHATFQYGNNYIVAKYFDKKQSAIMYYDSALFNADDDISSEYKIDFYDSLPAIYSDTLTYSYTNYLNPEFYISQFEYPTHFHYNVPLLAVSRHFPSGVIGTMNGSTASYTYQTDNQERVLVQIDGKGNPIKTYSYY